MKKISIVLALCALVWLTRTLVYGQNHVPHAADPGKTWAVIVGISAYQNITGLNYADKDAIAVRDYLVKTIGGSKMPANHLRVLINQQARATEIYGLLDWLKESVKKGDRVIFFFSGHGDVEKNGTHKTAYLLAHDSPASAYMTGGTVAISHLMAYADRFVKTNGAKDVLLIIDACRSGTQADGEQNIPAFDRALSEKADRRIMQLLSAQENELSAEGTKWGGGQGVFSYYLIKGVTGAANSNNDHEVTTSELAVYLQLKIPEATGNKQHPLIYASPDVVLFPVRNGAGKTSSDSPPKGWGFGTGIAEKLPDNIRNQYQLYLDDLSRGAVLYGPQRRYGVNCAAPIYRQLIRDPAAGPIKASLSSSFKAALQRRTQMVMLDNLSEETETTDTTVIKEMMYARTLVDTGDVLYNDVNAKALFMESLYHRTPSTKITLLTRALDFEPDASYILDHLGNVYMEIGKTDSAVFYLKKAISAAPGWAMPYVNLGLAYHRLHDPAKEAASYQKAIEIDSANADAYNNLGAHYEITGDYKNALRMNKKAVQILESKPNFRDSAATSRFYYNLGVVYERLGQYSKAETMHLKAASLDSTQAIHYEGLGLVYQDQNILDKSLHYHLKALKLDPGNPRVNFNIGTVYLTQGDAGDALRYFIKSAEQDSTQAYVHYYCGMAYLSMGDFAQAFKYARKAFQLDSGEVKYRALLGYCYVIKKDILRAEPLLTSAMRLNPQDPDINYNLACGWSLAGNAANGISCLKKALDRGFNNYNQLMQDNDLADLRKMPEFMALIKKYFPAGK